MAGDFKTKSGVGLGITETTKGTYLEPTVAGVELYDLAPIQVDMAPVRVGELANGSFQKGKYYSGVRKGTCSFKTELKGSGDSTIAPAIGAFLEASGMREQTVNGSDIGYIFDGIPSCGSMSFRYQMYNCGTLPEGFKQTMRGAKCNLKLSATSVGAPITLDFEMSGVARGEEDVTAGAPLVAAPIDTTDCEKFMGVDMTIGGYVGQITSIEMEVGGTLSFKTDANNQEGIAYVDLTDADPKITVGFSVSDVASKDFYTDQKNDVVYNNITIEMSQFDIIIDSPQLYEASIEDADGFAGRKQTYAVKSFQINQK